MENNQALVNSGTLKNPPNFEGFPAGLEYTRPRTLRRTPAGLKGLEIDAKIEGYARDGPKFIRFSEVKIGDNLIIQNLFVHQFIIGN